MAVKLEGTRKVKGLAMLGARTRAPLFEWFAIVAVIIVATSATTLEGCGPLGTECGELQQGECGLRPENGEPNDIAICRMLRQAGGDNFGTWNELRQYALRHRVVPILQWSDFNDMALLASLSVPVIVRGAFTSRWGAVNVWDAQFFRERCKALHLAVAQSTPVFRYFFPEVGFACAHGCRC